MPTALDRMVAAAQEALVELRQERLRIDTQIAQVESLVKTHQPNGDVYRQETPADPIEKVNGRRRESRGLLEMLIEDGPQRFMARDLTARAGELGLTPGSVSGGLHRLVQDGKVRHLSRGQYEVAS
jgi:hypothetical protein